MSSPYLCGNSLLQQRLTSERIQPHSISAWPLIRSQPSLQKPSSVSDLPRWPKPDHGLRSFDLRVTIGYWGNLDIMFIIKLDMNWASGLWWTRGFHSVAARGKHEGSRGGCSDLWAFAKCLAKYSCGIFRQIVDREISNRMVNCNSHALVDISLQVESPLGGSDQQ